MRLTERIYMCIDLKSFYASVECVERGIDPLKAKLVVADPSRTEKTICLAVSPALKAQGVKNRCRVFEIPDGTEYIMAVPRMALYIEYSTRIYSIYLRHISKEDIHVYSIDEVFIDAGMYIRANGISAREFAQLIMNEILEETGITATCGIGTNMYLAKIALDIISKHTSDHIGILDEQSYRDKLWNHRPLSDFWRISTGTIERLRRLGITNMREIAYANESVLYKAFGIDAQLLIDHAWGREITTMSDIKSYRPQMKSLSSGQVLPRGYEREEAELVVREMAENLSYDMFSKGLTTDSVTLYLSYDGWDGCKGTAKTGARTASVGKLTGLCTALYKDIARNEGRVRRINICFNRTQPDGGVQYDFFSDARSQEREYDMQTAIVGIKGKYGKNGLLRGSDLLDGARAIERNAQIGGHRA